MVPPPALISAKSANGKRTGYPLPLTPRPLCVLPAASNSCATCTRPSTIAPAFAVVPPISNPSTRGRCMVCANAAAAVAPLAGPLSISAAGRSRTSAAVVSPPSLRMM